MEWETDLEADGADGVGEGVMEGAVNGAVAE